ncbi:tRNA synthetases class I (M)-domain-containing protein [Bisporella sp. PMI_857]|nr:tRNA synthetases class I (M)-domain-containing protein [Bisporella sp. PMI_857]
MNGTASKKPYYLTTPIFYVNAAPHIGHLYTMVLADILKRWHTFIGSKAILCTGTDEHGMKIQQAAAKANMDPKEFCDSTAKTFKALAKRADIANDHFIRTTDETHKVAVQHFWQELEARGYIYESKHEGWYCVSDETFYPESAIEKRLDPFTGRTFMASQETGKEVEWTSEKNYHFRLSELKEKLLQYYRSHPDFIVPSTRMNDVVRWVSEGLEDLSISRPIERLSWGVRVPGDDSQTIYVWLDALVNYITKAGYPWAPGSERSLGWPADVQIIGKDIVRFHCIYWPAFLMALDIDPPKQILTHAHWTMGHQKMSKSIGNVVNPFFAIDRFGVDVMRFYLTLDGGIADDADYGNHLIVEKYKKNLQGGLGNLVSRIMKSKLWNVRSSIIRAQADSLLFDPLTDAHVAMIEPLSKLMNKKIHDLDPGAALKLLMDAVFETNKYLSTNEPWNLAKAGKSNSSELQNIIYHCAESLRIIGILLQPFMPSKAAKMLDILGVDPKMRTYEMAVLGADTKYGVPLVPLGNSAWDALFPPLPVED